MADRLGDPRPRRVLVLRALQLGDLLCAVPALRSLRQGLPDAEITLLGLPWAREFVTRFPAYLDCFLEFPGYPGLPEKPCDPRAIPPFLEAVQEQRFDLVIQMQGDGSIVNPLVTLLGARHSAGFRTMAGYAPDPDRFLIYPEGISELRRHLMLARFLGLPHTGEHLEFPIRPTDESEWHALAETAGLRRGGFVCIHPGARADDRRWPSTRFAAVADALAARGLRVVLTGTDEERPLTRAVADAMRGPAIDLAGRTSLGALAVGLTRCRLLVANDTGVSHLAAALRVPSVVVFSASDPDRWAPLDRELHRVVIGGVVVKALPSEVLTHALQLLDARVSTPSMTASAQVVVAAG